MIDRTHQLPVRRQAQFLELSRSAVYYQAVPVSDDDLASCVGSTNCRDHEHGAVEHI